MIRCDFLLSSDILLWAAVDAQLIVEQSNYTNDALHGVLIWHVSEPREINRAITRYVVDRVDLLAVRPAFGMQPCRFFNPDSPS